MDRPKFKFFHIISVCVLLACTILLVYAGITDKEENISLFNKEIYEFDEGWTLTESEDGQTEKIHFPYIHNGEKPDLNDEAAAPADREGPGADRGEKKEHNTILLENTIPKEYQGMTLILPSRTSHFEVRIDGQVVYENNLSGWKRIMGQTDKLYFINIPKTFTEGKIQITLSATQDQRIEYIRIATQNATILNLLMKNLFNVLCSLVMVICSVVLALMIIIRKQSGKKRRGLGYLSFFCVVAGLYYAVDTQILAIFIGKPAVLYLLVYICMMLMPFLLILYYTESMEKKFRRYFLLFFWLAVINIVMQLLLQIFEIVNFHSMQFFSYFLLIASSVFALVCLGRTCEKGMARRDVCKIAVIVPFLLCEVVDLIYILQRDASMTMKFGRFGMTLFCMVMMLYYIMSVSNEYAASVAENARLLEREIENVQRRNEELMAAKEEAETARKEAILANEAKEHFLANMSHEIRTPINAVLGMNEMILRESREPETKEYAMDIQNAGKNLLSLVNDILDFSKISSGKMEIVPVRYDFSSMVHDVVNMIYFKAQAKALELDVKVDGALPSELYGDDVRIRQILVNILSNAVKYTKEGKVSLRINGHTEGETVSLLFEVEDTGIGIRKEDLSKLFVEFERIEEKRNRSIEGTGLGMNITMQLLRLMGSKLEVESEYGKGSRFYFTLEQKVENGEPIGDLEERIRQVSEEFTYNVTFTAPEARVLIVDDNPTNCRVFQNLLKETQMKIDAAESGMMCLELVQKNVYDMIFLDYMMPEMTGIETLQNMKALTAYPSEKAVVVALTADAVTGARETYLNAGFNDYLSKPILVDKLERMLRQYLPESKVILEKIPAGMADDRKKAEETEALPQVDGIDWDYAKMHLPGVELLKDTVRDFYGTLDGQADALQDHYESGDRENYRILVHSMKGAAAMIGIVPLAGMAKILEYAAGNGQWDIVEQMHGIFLNEWRGYKEKLSVMIEDELSEKQSIEDVQIVLAYLEMLRVAMNDLDIDAADETMEHLRQYEYTGEMAESFQRLETAVANLDTDHAEMEIVKIMDTITAV